MTQEVAKILIVEDEKSVLSSLSQYLRKEGYEVLEAESLAKARTSVDKNPHLILLDWQLGDGQGIDLLREWRMQNISTPIFMLTARTELIDRVVGLELGADDYITKPFEPRELSARIKVWLRRSSATAVPPSSKLAFSGIEMEFGTREVRYGNKTLDLTKTEFELLKFFIENPNQVFSREELLNKVWGYEQSPTTRTVDTHVLQLRQKLRPDFFETVHGIGYRLRNWSPKEDQT